MHFVHQFQYFEVFLKCVFVIFKNCVFSQKFCEPLSALVNPICFSINRNCFKIFKRSLCLFRSIKNHESSFLKTEFDLFKLTFQKKIQTFLSLNWTRLTNKFFVVFLRNFCKVFLSLSL